MIADRERAVSSSFICPLPLISALLDTEVGGALAINRTCVARGRPPSTAVESTGAKVSVWVNVGSTGEGAEKSR
jgi:hypothetical protein